MSEQLLNEVELFLSNELAWRKKIVSPTDFCKGEIHAFERLHNSLKDSRTKPQSDDTGKVLLTKEQADKIRNALESARNALESSYNVLEYPGTRDCHQGRAADECTEALKVLSQEANQPKQSGPV